MFWPADGGNCHYFPRGQGRQYLSLSVFDFSNGLMHDPERGVALCVEQPTSVGNHTTTPLHQQYCGGCTCIEHGSILAAALLNPFSVGMQAIWNRPQQNGAANLQLWDGVLVQRLGSIWVVQRIQNRTAVRDPSWEDFSQLNSVIGNERNMWKRV